MIDNGLIIFKDGTTAEISCDIKDFDISDLVICNIETSMKSIPLINKTIEFDCHIDYIDMEPFMPVYDNIRNYLPVPDMPGYMYYFSNGERYVISKELLQTVIDGYNSAVNKTRSVLRDFEWNVAENSKEKPVYYFMEMYNGGRCIKKYKPAVAKLVSKRTGLKITPVC